MTTGIIYHGSHTATNTAGPVWLEDNGQIVGALRHYERHSPTGFSWGYGGSGPADLARCLLIDALGDDAKCPTCAGVGWIIYDPETDQYAPAPRAALAAHLARPKVTDPDELDETADTIGKCWECQGDGIGDLVGRLYQDFKWQVVAHFPDTWELSRADVLAWTANHR